MTTLFSRSKLLLFSLFAVALFILMGTARPMHAAPAAPEWAKWEVDVSFINGNIIGNWHISIGSYVGITPKTLHMETIPLKCWTVGDAAVAADHVALNGAGNVSCWMPDFAATVDQIIIDKFGPAFVLELDGTELCDCKPGRTQPVVVQTKAVPTKAGVNPVFEHPSFNFALDYDGKYVRNVLDVNGIVNESIPTLMPSALTELRSEYECNDGLATCTATHLLNSGVFDEVINPYVQPWLTTDGTVITVGDGFSGKMYNVYADPGCRVT